MKCNCLLGDPNIVGPADNCPIHSKSKPMSKQLPEEINIEKIEALLKEYYTKNKEGKGGGYGLRLLKSIKTTEAQRAQVLVEALEKIKGWNADYHTTAIATDALNQYKQQ